MLRLHTVLRRSVMSPLGSTQLHGINTACWNPSYSSAPVVEPSSQ
jgi:hypothetical protein